jgi:hypothetical protein
MGHVYALEGPTTARVEDFYGNFLRADLFLVHDNAALSKSEMLTVLGHAGQVVCNLHIQLGAKVP